MTTATKPTIATVKNFINRNINRLLIKVSSDFDGMTDCVTSSGCEKRFVPVSSSSNPLPKYNLGLRGVWFTNGRNEVYYFENETHVGYEVSNCCGSWTVAILKA